MRPIPKAAGWLLCLSLIRLPAHSQTLRCGTLQWFRAHPHGAAGRASGAAQGTAAVPPPYRTLETPHFAIHYALRGVHRIKIPDADSAFARLLDSLYASVSGLVGSRTRDSAVVARLDALAAPHPLYAATLAGFLERAWEDYVARLGMKAPVISVPSHFFRAPAGTSGRYPVEVVDVVTAVAQSADPFPLNPQTYALTFQPGLGGMFFENDFLYNSTTDPTGTFPVGDSLKSCYPAACTDGGNLIHNYAVEWEAGAEVTAFHEFYHAVQLTYTPDPAAFHVWYETGAVGMEERNAPEVNDYFQYLPGYFANLGNAGMFTYAEREALANSLYGNGIFHVYLARELGEGFDREVWSLLEGNGNDIRQALPVLFAAHGLTAGQVWSGYAAQLSFSGRSLAAPFPIFSPDMAAWPRLPAPELDLSGTAPAGTAPQPPFSISARRLTGTGAGKGLFPSEAGLEPVLAELGPDSGRVGLPVTFPFPLPADSAPGAETLLILANASLTDAGSAAIREFRSIASTRLFAYPNPKRMAGTADRLLFSRLPDAAIIDIYGEGGLLIRRLEFAPEEPVWSWDLMDGEGRPVEPGLYYFGSGGRTLSPLVLL